MSGGLRTIAVRYAAGLRAAELVASVGDERRSHVLRCVMRYGLIWNAVYCEMSCCKLEGDEWEERFVERSEYYHSHFGNAPTREWRDETNSVIPYIRYHMLWMFPDFKTVREGVWPKVLDEAELPKVVRWFLDLPQRHLYGYKG